MSKFITLSKIERTASRYDEDTQQEIHTEESKPCLVNADAIRCLYGRRDGKPGSRLTFTDGGGFAVSEQPDAIAAMIAGGDVPNSLALAPAASPASN
jgi:hypothetical protein